MSKICTDHLPTRFVGLAAADFVCRFMIQARMKLGLDCDETLIASFVVSRSVQNLFQNRYEARNYGFEAQALPPMERSAVSIKDITSCLHIPRETVRRKLINLLDKKIVIKTDDGYIFPPQVNEMDKTSEFRKSIEESFNIMLKRLEKIDPLSCPICNPAPHDRRPKASLS